MTIAARSVRLANGLNVPYARSGERSGTPLVLLHGFTDSWRSFEPLIARLPASIPVIAPTQRGHGEADRPAGPYDLPAFAGDLAEFLDALAIDRAIVAGHSMGSAVALRFAVDHPDRVAGVALLGAFATLDGNPAAEELRDAVGLLREPIDPIFAREFQESTLARPIPAAFVNMVVEESLKVPLRVWRAALAGLFATGIETMLGRIDVPALLLWGDCDGLLPRPQQEALAASLRDARLKVYEGCGHGLHWDDPARAAADLAAFHAAIGRPAQATAAARRALGALQARQGS